MTQTVSYKTYLTILLELSVPLIVALCTTRNYTQICTNCKASASCGTSVGSFVAVLCYEACFGNWEYPCSMGVIKDLIDPCSHYYPCTEVTVAEGYTTWRRTCRDDCLEVKVTYYNLSRGACGSINIYYANEVETEEECLSLCLDRHDCGGVTFSIDGCELHGCNERVDHGYQVFIKLICNSTATSVITSSVTMKTTPSVSTVTTTGTSKTTQETGTGVITSPLTTTDTLLVSTIAIPASAKTVSKRQTAQATTPDTFANFSTQVVSRTFSSSTLAIVANKSALAFPTSTSEATIKMQSNSTASPMHLLSKSTTLTESTTVLSTVNMQNSVSITPVTLSSEEWNDDYGFFDKPVNLALLSSIGAILSVGGISTGIYMLIAPQRFCTKKRRDHF